MSIEQHKQTMIQAKERNARLVGLTSDSKVSVWGNMLYIFAYCAEVISQMFTQHRAEMDGKIANQKTHRLAWIRDLYLNFQYGFDLMAESDQFDNGSATDEEIESSKIIKYCAVNESSTQREVIIKIATETNDELSPIDSDKMEAILAYTKEVKGTGVPYRIINYLPDLLKLNIRIFRDALVLDGSGMNRQTGEKSVEIALQEFMKELPFNGELRLQDLANKLEKVPGVNLVEIDLAQSAWIDAQNGTYGAFETIDVRKIPASGYFKIVDFRGIRYVV
ncbi:nucleotidyltransferase [Weeksella virosa]|uniref:nucleotidyltransferase n=1 Tax=Weeksella virosa TaxID=1014 RepID=UPI002556FEFD|nr:nucleotidyltransferase [Weeksella virosa]MDK7675112.1 nucleotidyltransferase [Weeksella virosa]